MGPYLVPIATAMSLLFTCAGPAKAICFLGKGDTCPISDSDATAEILPYVDGKLEGAFEAPRYLDRVRFNSSDSSAKKQVLQQVIDVLNSGGDCVQIDKLVPPASAFYSWQQNCTLA